MINLSQHSKGTLISILGVLCLSPDSFLIRSVSSIDPSTVMFYRYTFCACTLTLVLLIMERSRFVEKFLRIGPYGLLAGLIWGVSNIFFTKAIQNTAAASALVIVATNPVFATLFSFIILREAIELRMIITSLVSFAAILLIFSQDLTGASSSSSSSTNTAGMLYAVGASLTLGLYFVILRLATLKQDTNPEIIPTNIVAGLTVTLIIGSQLTATSPSSLSLLSSTISSSSSTPKIELFLLCFQGLVSIPLAFSFLAIGPSLISASEVSLYMLIETVIGPVIVWIGGFEPPPPLTVYGGLMMMAALSVNGVYSLYLERKKEEEERRKKEEEEELEEGKERDLEEGNEKEGEGEGEGKGEREREENERGERFEEGGRREGGEEEEEKKREIKEGEGVTKEEEKEEIKEEKEEEKEEEIKIDDVDIDLGTREEEDEEDGEEEIGEKEEEKVEVEGKDEEGKEEEEKEEIEGKEKEEGEGENKRERDEEERE